MSVYSCLLEGTGQKMTIKRKKAVIKKVGGYHGETLDLNLIKNIVLMCLSVIDEKNLKGIDNKINSFLDGNQYFENESNLEVLSIDLLMNFFIYRKYELASWVFMKDIYGSFSKDEPISTWNSRMKGILSNDEICCQMGVKKMNRRRKAKSVFLDFQRIAFILFLRISRLEIIPNDDVLSGLYSSFLDWEAFNRERIFYGVWVTHQFKADLDRNQQEKTVELHNGKGIIKAFEASMGDLREKNVVERYADYYLIEKLFAVKTAAEFFDLFGVRFNVWDESCSYYRSVKKSMDERKNVFSEEYSQELENYMETVHKDMLFLLDDYARFRVIPFVFSRSGIYRYLSQDVNQAGRKDDINIFDVQFCGLLFELFKEAVEYVCDDSNQLEKTMIDWLVTKKVKDVNDSLAQFYQKDLEDLVNKKLFLKTFGVLYELGRTAI